MTKSCKAPAEIPATGIRRLTDKLRRAGLLACVAIAVPCATGQINSPRADGYLSRSSIMSADNNCHGALDQLSEALRLIPAGDATRKAELQQALSLAHLPAGRRAALEAVERWLTEYPAAPGHETALLALANLHFDLEEFADALRIYKTIPIDALGEAQAADCLYHLGYCQLKMANYHAAERCYTRLTGYSDYYNNAQFYLGYIAYAKEDYATAERCFANVRPDGMPSELAPYYLAQIFYRQGRYREAAAAAGRLLANPHAQAEPEFIAEAERIAGESAWHDGNISEAVAHLEKYLTLTSEPLPSALYVLGVANYDKGAYMTAIEMLPAVTGEDNAMGQSALLYLGLANLRLGNYNSASLSLDKASRMTHSPETQEQALYNLAVAKTEGGKVPFGNTTALLEEYLTRFPNSSHASEVADYMVTGYATENNYPAALAAIEKVRRPDRKILATKQKVLYTLGTRELQSGQSRSALNHLSEAAAMKGYDDSTAAEALLWMGEAQYQLGEYGDAIESYNLYLRQPQGSQLNRALAYYDLGYARFARKEFTAAKKDFTRFLQDAPAAVEPSLRADALNRLADSQYYTGDFRGAEADYRRSATVNPKTADYPTFQLGLMQGLQRDHNTKIATLNELITTFPGSSLIPNALLEIADSYGELSRPQDAIDTYTKLINLYPTTAQGRKGELLLAITYLHNNNRTAALNHYKHVITAFPTSEEARVASDDLKQIYADEGRVGDYMTFINSIPDAPRPEMAEMARLTLLSAEKALEANRLNDAWQNANDVVSRYPDSESAIEALALRAEVERRQGRSPEALASYTALAEKASESADINNARMGILRVSRDLGDNPLTIATADQLLTSSALGASDHREVTFIKALALSDQGNTAEAMTLWEELGEDADDLYGTKSLYYIALAHFDGHRDAEAKIAVNRLIDANPPHDYWLAKGFILLSDLLRREGNEFEANEYLRSLRENYPGTEPDIFREIEVRLK